MIEIRANVTTSWRKRVDLDKLNYSATPNSETSTPFLQFLFPRPDIIQKSEEYIMSGRDNSCFTIRNNNIYRSFVSSKKSCVMIKLGLCWPNTESTTVFFKNRITTKHNIQRRNIQTLYTSYSGVWILTLRFTMLLDRGNVLFRAWKIINITVKTRSN